MRLAALYTVADADSAPEAVYYDPGGEALSFPRPRIDGPGFYAMPRLLRYPPELGRPLLLVGYCYSDLHLPASYHVTRRIVLPLNDCASTAQPRRLNRAAR